MSTTERPLQDIDDASLFQSAMADPPSQEATADKAPEPVKPEATPEPARPEQQPEQETTSGESEQKPQQQPRLRPKTGFDGQAAPRVTPHVGPASSTDTTYPSRYIFDDYGFIPRRRP